MKYKYPYIITYRESPKGKLQRGLHYAPSIKIAKEQIDQKFAKGRIIVSVKLSKDPNHKRIKY